MFLSNISIKRPVFAAVMMLTLVVMGVFSYRRLAIDLYPDVEFPALTIVTVYAGASPETVEREVTKKIEESVNPIAGVKHITSQSREGVSLVIVEFELEVRANDAAQEARTKVAAIRSDLPQDIEEPVIEKMDIGGMPVVSVAVSSDTVSAREVSDLVEKRIRRRLENIPGVGRLDVVGPSTREVSVLLDPARLDALGMGVDEVVAGLRSENVNTPVGRLDRGSSEVPLRISGRPKQVEQFADMVIGQRDGVPVRLGEVATIVDGVEEQRSLAFVNGRPSVAMDILKQTGANTVQVVDDVKAQIEKLRAELPAGVDIEIARDASIMIRDSVTDVQHTMIIGGILTILIVMLFLASWRSTVITGLTLPIAVISSFIVMNFAGMTLNVMTLMGLSLAIGLLIDDAIVVRENIVRHLEHGKDHFTAAKDGTAEIGLAVLATTMSIVAVFVPVAFMKGIVGRFFFEFGITVAFAVLVSLFVSFTLDPMLSSRWYDPDAERGARRSLIVRWLRLEQFNAWFDRTADRYRGLIRWALGHRKTVLGLASVAFVLGLVSFGLVQQEFFPASDQAEFQLNFTTSPDASLAETRDRLAAVLGAVGKIPGVAHTYATIGAGDQGTVRDAKIFVKLAEKADRDLRQKDIQRIAREELARIPGITPSLLEDTSSMAQRPIQMLVRGEELDKLKAYAAELKARMYTIPGIVDLEVTLEQDLPEYRLRIDRERAVGSGLMTADVVRTLGSLVGGQAVSTYEDQDGDAVDVRVRLPLDLRQDVQQVQDLRISVPRPEGGTALVPISELASYERAATPSQIDRRDLRRQVVVYANTQGLPIGTANERILEQVAQMKLEAGYSIVPAGDVEIMIESFGYMAEALLLAVILVYLILAAQFESFIDPLSIMLSLPLSIVGMAGMLLLTGDTINIMSLIGLIMLMGLVTKNAILLIDYGKVLRERGLSRTEAMIEAGRTRLRPIMMTTLAMIFGMLPLALALGAGAEMRAPMARAVIGGLITSTLLTLLVVPVVYTVLDDAQGWVRARLGRKRHVDEPLHGEAPVGAQEGRA